MEADLFEDFQSGSRGHQSVETAPLKVTKDKTLDECLPLFS